MAGARCYLRLRVSTAACCTHAETPSRIARLVSRRSISASLLACRCTCGTAVVLSTHGHCEIGCLRMHPYVSPPRPAFAEQSSVSSRSGPCPPQEQRRAYDGEEGWEGRRMGTLMLRPMLVGQHQRALSESRIQENRGLTGFAQRRKGLVRELRLSDMRGWKGREVQSLGRRPRGPLLQDNLAASANKSSSSNRKPLSSYDGTAMNTIV